MDTRRGPEVCRMRLPLDLDDHSHQHQLAFGCSSGPASEELLAQQSHHRLDHQDLGLPWATGGEGNLTSAQRSEDRFEAS